MASHTHIGRFFSVKNAAIALLVLALGAALGGYLVLGVIEEGRISIGGFALAGLLVLTGLGLLATIFPKGCKRCNRKFEQTQSVVCGTHFKLVQHALVTGDAPKIQWTTQTARSGMDKTTIQLAFCGGCRAIGLASASLERSNGQYDESIATSVEVPVGPGIISALSQPTPVLRTAIAH